MNRFITLQSIATDIHEHVKDLVTIPKSRILLELYIVLRYNTIFKTLGVTIKLEKDFIKVGGVFKKSYKVYKIMKVIGFDPTLNSIYNYMGFEKFDLFIDEQKIIYRNLEDYIVNTNIDINDLKETINNLKSSSVTVLGTGQMLNLHLDDYLGIKITPMPENVTTPYYLTFKEFTLLCR